jgi:hypothetical protein
MAQDTKEARRVTETAGDVGGGLLLNEEGTESFVLALQGELFAIGAKLFCVMPERWCTVTVTDAEGRRHSPDLLASSTYDAAHLYVTHAKQRPEARLPIPTLATIFKVVTGGKVYTVDGAALQRWIEPRRQDWKGPRGLLFSQRPILR